MATRQIFGTISPDGNKMSGEGFNCRIIKEGTYLIEFEQPFNGEPAPVCTVNGNEWYTFNKSVAIVDISPSHFICTTSSPNRPENCGFTFIVIGDE